LTPQFYYSQQQLVAAMLSALAQALPSPPKKSAKTNEMLQNLSKFPPSLPAQLSKEFFLKV
jgi:hypothetical protein